MTHLCRKIGHFVVNVNEPYFPKTTSAFVFNDVTSVSASYVRDGILYLKATLTSDVFGENFLTSGLLDYW